MNIAMLLEMAASGFGDRVAFVDAEAGVALTYQELFDAASAAASAVRDSGAQRLTMLDVSSLAVPVGLFASAWAGVPYVPLNYRLTQAELKMLIERVKPAYLVTEPERLSTYQGDSALHTTSRLEFLNQAKTGKAMTDPWPMDPDDIAVLLFTSGTTGEPKAAVLRHKHLVSYILGSVEYMSADDDEASLVCVPPYHVAGIAAVLSSVYSGRRVVQLANFSPETWLDIARTEKITSAFVVPTMLSRLVGALEGESSANLPQLQSLSYGGGKMPLQVIQRAMTLFPNTDFTNAYGLTETSSTVTLLGPDEHRTAAASHDPKIRMRLVSAGLALPGIEIEIRDEDGKTQGPGQPGEIYVRGEQVSGEYEGLGSRLDADGWFPTRDAGFMDADGYLFLRGRADDVIVRGGENMSPGEIEDALLEHPAVADVAIVGVPSEEWGEAVAGAVVLKGSANEDELKLWVRERMRSSRVPETLQFWDELPYNDTGKLLRRVVREKLA